MLAWLRDLSSRERRTMLACWGGWTLDGFDQQLYSYVVPTVIAVWGMSTGAAGTIGTVTVVTSSFGGWFAGALSDRYGRVRVLQITVLWYAVFTFLCGFAQNFEQLFVLRALQGLGFGAEWSAGAVLMGEIIRDKYRGRAVGGLGGGIGQGVLLAGPLTSPVAIQGLDSMGGWVQLKFKPLAHDACVCDSFGYIAKECSHLASSTQKARRILSEQAPGLIEWDVMAYGGENIENFAIFFGRVTRTIGRDDR